jgi:hypothetical protein
MSSPAKADGCPKNRRRSILQSNSSHRCETRQDQRIDNRVGCPRTRCRQLLHNSTENRRLLHSIASILIILVTTHKDTCWTSRLMAQWPPHETSTGLRMKRRSLIHPVMLKIRLPAVLRQRGPKLCQQGSPSRSFTTSQRPLWAMHICLNGMSMTSLRAWGSKCELNHSLVFKIPFRGMGYKMRINPFNRVQNGITTHVIQNAISWHVVQNASQTIQ